MQEKCRFSPGDKVKVYYRYRPASSIYGGYKVKSPTVYTVLAVRDDRFLALEGVVTDSGYRAWFRATDFEKVEEEE